jgi:hypothetical protein
MFQSTAIDSALWLQKPKCNGYMRKGKCGSHSVQRSHLPTCAVWTVLQTAWKQKFCATEVNKVLLSIGTRLAVKVIALALNLLSSVSERHLNKLQRSNKYEFRLSREQNKKAGRPLAILRYYPRNGYGFSYFLSCPVLKCEVSWSPKSISAQNEEENAVRNKMSVR